jgi:hypothetical protein
MENWNSANGFIHYGKSGEFASNRRGGPGALDALVAPAPDSHVNPYGVFNLDLSTRLPFDAAA